MVIFFRVAVLIRILVFGVIYGGSGGSLSLLTVDPVTARSEVRVESQTVISSGCAW